jgi:CubicO group peptidase (beta-lactamase class C family)
LPDGPTARRAAGLAFAASNAIIRTTRHGVLGVGAAAGPCRKPRRETMPPITDRPGCRAGLSRGAVVLALCCAGPGAGAAEAPPPDPALLGRIDSFVEGERQASGIPGIALAIVQPGGAVHVRGFGHDGRGAAIGADTPFPIGSLTKSFTALLVRQAIDAGELDADAPLQRVLPWFRLADAEASARITLRHLLNQTSGLSRADGIAALLHGGPAGIEELSRGLGGVALDRPVGERFEYSNLNFVLLGAALQAATGRSWHELVRTRVLAPLQMRHSHADLDAAQRAGMTAVHRMWFGVPVAQPVHLQPGLAPTGGLVASAADMARYLAMLLASGVGPAGRVVSADGVAQLLAPATKPARSRLLSADFAFRYGQGWFVGPFGAAAEARWHLGNLPSFAAWMVLLPDTRQAVVVLVNANTELPFNEANAVMSRLPIGVVKLLRGEPVPQGPSLRRAYLPFNVASAGIVGALLALAFGAIRTRRARGSVALLAVAVGTAAALQTAGSGVSTLWAFAPDLAMVLAAALVLLCVPAPWRAAAWARRSMAGASRSPR